MIDNIPKDKRLILFDGVCNLCNSSVLFVIKRDRHHKFLFAPLQSEVGEQIINAFNIDTEETDSIILYNPETNRIYHKSSAALHVAKALRFPVNIMRVFFIIPRGLRNWVYDIIARNRYRWFGRKDSCMIPTPELQAKFVA